MAKHVQTNIRLTEYDRDLIASLQCDFINHLPREVKGAKRILSISDVIRASVRHLALARNSAWLASAYASLLMERVYDESSHPSQPIDATDRSTP